MLRRLFQKTGFLATRPPLHFLHIGKTGGTAVRHALRDHLTTPKFRLVMHSHPTTLRDVPNGEGIVFFLRDPVSRFASGFVSRLRQGKPRYDVPWTEKERVAFQRFGTPDELGKGLSSDCDETRNAAEKAMKGINHVRFVYADWFADIAYFESRQDDVFFVGFQESLEMDFERLRTKLELPATVSLPKDSVAAHRTPEKSDRTLSEEAVRNLKRYFKDDYEFLERCRQLSQKQ